MCGLNGIRLLVSLLSSRAIVKPRIVTRIAVVFRYIGIVIMNVLVVGKLWVMKNPKIMLPQASRLMGLISCGIFSCINIIGE